MGSLIGRDGKFMYNPGEVVFKISTCRGGR